MYLAIDPGQSTGWAVFTKTGTPTDMGTCRSPEEFFDHLRNKNPDDYLAIIVEEYKLYQRKALQQSGSDMVAPRVIGAVQYWAHTTPIVFQPASIKGIAEMWSGKKPPSNHKYSHEIDAYNHGYYYLRKQGIIKVAS